MMTWTCSACGGENQDTDGLCAFCGAPHKTSPSRPRGAGHAGLSIANGALTGCLARPIRGTDPWFRKGEVLITLG